MAVKYIAIWSVLFAIAFVNGAVRELTYGQLVRELTAHQISSVSGIVLFGIAIWFITGQWRLQSAPQALLVGLIWAVITVAFEFLFGHYAMGHPWSRLWDDYNVLAGRLWMCVLAWIATAPLVFYMWHNRVDGRHVGEMRVVSDLVYRADSERGVLDLYLPAREGRSPVVVVIHGGGWYDGDKERMREYREILAEAGIAAAIPNYRLTGIHSHPAKESDMLAVLEWIAANAQQYELDPTRVGLTGISTGGHLAALVGLKATKREKRASSGAAYAVRCMMPIYGPHDLQARAEERPDRVHVIEALLGGPAVERQDLLKDASPIEHVHSAAPACLAVHGEEDRLVAPFHSERLVQALQATGAKAQLLIVPGAGHGRYQPDTDPPEPLGNAELLRSFFQRHLLKE